MRVAKAFVGARGFDTVNTVDTVMASTMRSGVLTPAWPLQGPLDFAVRYLGLLTGNEAGVITAGGLALMPVTLSRGPGWTPSGALGEIDGQGALRQLRAAGLPPGITVWRDLEGPAEAPSAVIDYVNSWSRILRSEGYDPGLYVGYGCHLSGRQLQALAVDRYWHSLSRVTDDLGVTAEPARGWCMHQLYPTTTWRGHAVDINVVQQDYRGDVPTWVVA